VQPHDHQPKPLTWRGVFGACLLALVVVELLQVVVAVVFGGV